MAEPRAVEPDVHVTTACPLDCPDGCSLSVGVRDGRIVEIGDYHHCPWVLGAADSVRIA